MTCRSPQVQFAPSGPQRAAHKSDLSSCPATHLYRLDDRCWAIYTEGITGPSRGAAPTGAWLPVRATGRWLEQLFLLRLLSTCQQFSAIVTDSGVELGSGPGAEEPSSIGSSLLQRLKLESPEAWRRLVHLFGPLVYQWCRRYGLQAADATDVGQEVFRTVACRIGRFRRDRPADTFRGWLWTITRSRIVDNWRRQQRQPQATGGSTAQIRLANLAAAEPGDLPTSEPEVQHSLYRRGLQLIQDEFAQRTWKAFWRVAVDGCPPVEVAEELGLSVNSVYLAKSRVLRRLREELGDLLD